VTFHILFVCTGNVCRSPAAERLLSQELDGLGDGIAGLSGVQVSSAGTAALVGDPVSPPMAALLEEAGADASGFAARQLSPPLVRAADLIITMTSAHRRETVTMVPAAVQRTFVLGELAHMLGGVRDDEIAAAGGASGSTTERLRAAMTIAKRHRTPGVDPAEDIVDPYGRSNSVYSASFAQIRAALEPLRRIIADGLSR
jgi:protein-tyrosine phosphatase